MIQWEPAQFFRLSAKVSFEPVLLSSSGVSCSRLWREFAIKLRPEVYMPRGLVASLWQGLFPLAHRRPLWLRFCLFPLRTSSVFLFSPFSFSISKSSTEFRFPLPGSALLLLTCKSPASKIISCASPSSLSGEMPFLWVHEIQTSESIWGCLRFLG